MGTKKSDRPRRGVIAHLVAKSMGLDDPCVLVLSSGERIPGPVSGLVRDPQLKTSSKTSSTLAAVLGDGRQIYVNDIDDVTLQDGGPLPSGGSNSGLAVTW